MKEKWNSSPIEVGAEESRIAIHLRPPAPTGGYDSEPCVKAGRESKLHLLELYKKMERENIICLKNGGVIKYDEDGIFHHPDPEENFGFEVGGGDTFVLANGEKLSITNENLSYDQAIKLGVEDFF